MNSKRHLLRSSCAGSYGFDIGGKYDSGFSHHPGHLYSLTDCVLLLIQSLSLPSALLEEFDLTWESMNSSTQQNVTLPQSTGSRQKSVLYADASLDMLLDELRLWWLLFTRMEDTHGSLYTIHLFTNTARQMCCPFQLPT